MESDESIHAHCDFQARWVFLSKFFIFVWFLFFILLSILFCALSHLVPRETHFPF